MPGAGKCNPSCCFQALGLENATPPPVFKAWGWKLEFEATVISVYDEPCTSYVLMPQASGSQYPPGLPQEGPKALPGPPITPQGLFETPGRRPGAPRDAPGCPPGALRCLPPGLPRRPQDHPLAPQGLSGAPKMAEFGRPTWQRLNRFGGRFGQSSGPPREPPKHPTWLIWTSRNCTLWVGLGVGLGRNQVRHSTHPSTNQFDSPPAQVR